MLQTFDAPTADALWQQLKDALCCGPSVAIQAGRGGETREILHAGVSIADPRQRWVVSREPSLNPAFALAEVVWILRGRRDSAFLNYFNHQLCRYAGSGETYHGAYGHRLIRHFGINQLERAYLTLQSRQDSRQVVLQMWDAASDLPLPDGSPAAEDIPCNITSLLKLRDGRLEWLQVMRSNDVFLGLPHNLVQFTTLQEVIAGWLGVGLGSYNHVSDSLHVYQKDCEDLFRSRPVLVEVNNDSCALPKPESDVAWAKLEEAVERIIAPNASATDVLKKLETSDLPAALRNILCVLSAEGIRRRGEILSARSAMLGCSNLVFVQLWERWLRRIRIERGSTVNYVG